MKPGFALSLSDERIDLLARTADGWMHLGAVAPDAADLPARMADLRAKALALSPEGMQTKLILPASQILYANIDAPGPDKASRRKQIEAALEGCTPYRVEELVFDWSGKGPNVQVAVVARMTLDEAEGFAEEFEFAPVSFVTCPAEGQFEGEPYFGPSKRQSAHLPNGARLDRDQQPVRTPFPPLDAGPVEAAPEAAPENLEVAPEAEATPQAPDVTPEPEPGPEHLEDTDAAADAPIAETGSQPEPALSAVEPADRADEANPSPEDSTASPEDQEPVEDEAPFTNVELSEDGDIFPENADEWIETPPMATDEETGETPAEDSGTAPGFTSHRSPSLAIGGATRLESITSRIQMATGAATPASTRRASNPARPLPPAASPLRAAPMPPLSHEDAIAAGGTLMRALDRVRAPVGKAEQEARQRANRRHLRNATAAAAVLFAGVVGLWWWYFDAQSESSSQAEVVASAPLAATEDGSAPQAISEENQPVGATPMDSGQAQTEPDAPTPEMAGSAPVPTDEPGPDLPALTPSLGAKPAPDAPVGRPDAAPESAVAGVLPAPLEETAVAGADPAPDTPSEPVAFGSLQRFDADGDVVPTAEGVRTREGIILYAGKPENAPPRRPAAIEALAVSTAEAAVPSQEPDAQEAQPATDLAGAQPTPDDTESVPEPLDPATAKKRPVARPAAIVPPTEPAAEPGNEPATVDEASAESAVPPDPVTAARQPLARPAAVETAAAEAPPAPVVTASRYAVATSPSPTARPARLNAAVDNRAVEAALAAALAESSATATASVAADEIDEPEPVSAAPDIPTKANVAKQATIANGIDLGELSLIGIFGPASKRHALVRTSRGKILNVSVGDKLDGGKVSAIGDGQLAYIKGGKTHVLKMTSKS
ncbi:hypothetical protein OEW28_07105 [Defluviimonas sp. WL0002]|uniref:Type IV pilus biogenesis protein PilP n=1 Tax=Albidovulum marisflavi TaxID=2984159 RepID=A0ABT2ZB89_9RHOB|nr:hypothetical protein [Defluviimonas sp. WL0002]MCV2868394.1 hypothetical protein [Defluviimonas sp. WL0002]